MILKQIFNILSLLYNDILGKLLSRSSNKKKTGIYCILTIILLFTIYYADNFTYILRMNATYFDYIVENNTLSKVIFFSIIVSSVIYVFTQKVIKLTQSAKHMLIILPFNRKAIGYGITFYKISIASAIYIALVPFLVAQYFIYINSFFVYLMYVTFFMLLFIIVYIMATILDKSIDMITEKFNFTINIGTYVVVIFTLILLQNYSLIIDIIAKADMSNSMIKYYIISMLIFIILEFVILSVIVQHPYTNISIDNFDKNTKLTFNNINITNKILLYISRKKDMIRIAMLVFICGVVYFVIKRDILILIWTVAYVYLILMATMLSYYTDTRGERKLYNLMNITAIKEMKSLIVVALILTTPIFILIGINEGLIYTSLFFILTIAGTIFPINKSNINEMLAMFTSMVLLVWLMKLQQNYGTYVLIIFYIGIVIANYMILQHKYVKFYRNE